VLAITAATALAQSKLQNDGVKAVNKATLAAQDTFNQDVRQRRDIANQSFQDSIAQAGEDQDRARFEEKVQQRIAANQPSFNQRTLLPGQGDASGAVKTAIVQAQNRAIDRNANAAETDARLNAYGDSALGRDIALGQNSNRISREAGFVQGSLNNLQADSAAAARAGDSKMAMADVIGGLGTLANAGYSMGAGAGWWGGTDPATDIRWNSGRASVPTITPAKDTKPPAGVAIGKI